MQPNRPIIDSFRPFFLTFCQLLIHFPHFPWYFSWYYGTLEPLLRPSTIMVLPAGPTSEECLVSATTVAAPTLARLNLLGVKGKEEIEGSPYVKWICLAMFFFSAQALLALRRHTSGGPPGSCRELMHKNREGACFVPGTLRTKHTKVN